MSDRGNYVPVNKIGTPVVYEPGDEVLYGGGRFKSLKRNTYLDGTPDNANIWERLSQTFTHSNGDSPHPNPNVGDEWYDKTSGILFKFLNDGNSDQWVEIS